MKKYLCLTTGDNFVKGEVYIKDEENKRIRILVRLGYIKEVPMNYGKKKKEVYKK